MRKDQTPNAKLKNSKPVASKGWSQQDMHDNAYGGGKLIDDKHVRIGRLLSIIICGVLIAKAANHRRH